MSTGYHAEEDPTLSLPPELNPDKMMENLFTSYFGISTAFLALIAIASKIIN